MNERITAEYGEGYDVSTVVFNVTITCPVEFLPVEGSNIEIKAIKSCYLLDVIRVMAASLSPS